MNSVASSASWRTIRLGGSSPPTSCPTAGFASPKTPVAAALTSGFASGNRRQLKPVSCGVREQKTLVGLTSLVTKNTPMLPKLNHRRALFIMTKIE